MMTTTNNDHAAPLGCADCARKDAEIERLNALLAEAETNLALLAENIETGFEDGKYYTRDDVHSLNILYLSRIEDLEKRLTKGKRGRPKTIEIPGGKDSDGQEIIHRVPLANAVPWFALLRAAADNRRLKDCRKNPWTGYEVPVQRIHHWLTKHKELIDLFTAKFPNFALNDVVAQTHKQG